MFDIPAAFNSASLWQMLAQSRKQHVRRHKLWPKAYTNQAAETPPRSSQTLGVHSWPKKLSCTVKALLRGNSSTYTWNKNIPNDTMAAMAKPKKPSLSTTRVMYFLNPGVLLTCEIKKSKPSTLCDMRNTFACSVAVSVSARARSTAPKPAKSLLTGTPRRRSSSAPTRLRPAGVASGRASRRPRPNLVEHWRAGAQSGSRVFHARMPDATRRTHATRCLNHQLA
mmetsp:Transcript_74162/g.226884  ORF Transcript_74162/g.226884 Transcript_74162/m.226884 type:complete len:225 (-) Transcript_74162:2-676(-)